MNILTFNFFFVLEKCQNVISLLGQSVDMHLSFAVAGLLQFITKL